MPEPGWTEHAVWWRVYPLGFVGAFPGHAQPGEHRLPRIVDWLDHAVELGASGLALGPVFASSTHGYDTLDHFAIDPRLGDDTDFDQLIAAAHDRGLRVQLDGVFNHVGRDHPQAQPGPGGWARSVDGQLDTFEGHEHLVALNHDDPAVRAHVVAVMRHWLDRGADAWRLDAAYRVPAEFWASVLPEVRRSHPDAWFEAEVIHGDYAGYVAASTVDTVTQYELWKAVWSGIEQHNFFELDWALQRHNAMLATFAPATFIGNHDVTRIASKIADPRHVPHAIALLAVLGGTPSIYAGDEFGFRAVKQDVAGGDDAIRPEFPAPTMLERGELFRLHQRLIGLRRRHSWLHRATSNAQVLRNRQYVLTMRGDGQSLTLALNLDDAELAIAPATVLDADDASRDRAGSVAPHGWSISR